MTKRHLNGLFCLVLCWSGALLAEPGFETGKTYYDLGSYTLAEETWLPLATQGDVQSQFYLGVLYDIGPNPIPKDDRAAALWFRMAAERGHITAQLYTGNAYANGRGVPQSNELALLWWGKAADNGSPEAQYRLGAYHFARNGEKVHRDKAMHYLKLAASNGHQKAAEIIVSRDFANLTRANATLPPAHGPIVVELPVTADDPTESVSTQVLDTPPPTKQGSSDTEQSPLDWLKSQNPAHFTIQLVAAKSDAGFGQFIRTYGLTGQTTAIKSETNNHAVRYFLLMSSFPNSQAAYDAISQLPENLRREKPWPRPFSELQALAGL